MRQAHRGFVTEHTGAILARVKTGEAADCVMLTGGLRLHGQRRRQNMAATPTRPRYSADRLSDAAIDREKLNQRPPAAHAQPGERHRARGRARRADAVSRPGSAPG